MIRIILFLIRFYIHGALKMFHQCFEKEDRTHLNLKHLRNKTIIITGGTSGVGRSMVNELLLNGATVIIGSPELPDDLSSLSNQFIYLNLASNKSITCFVEQVKSRYDKVDVLINNAGVMLVPYNLTESGLEMTMAVNFIGHAYLTHLFMPMIRRSDIGQVINISSSTHSTVSSSDVFELLHRVDKSEYLAHRSYGASKLAISMYTYSLSQHIHDVKFVSIHPGVVDTNLYQHVNMLFQLLLAISRRLFFYSSEHAARLVLKKTLIDVLPNGSYYGDGCVKFDSPDVQFQADCGRLYSLMQKTVLKL